MRVSANNPRAMACGAAAVSGGLLLSALLVVALFLTACSQEEADQEAEGDSYFSTSEFNRTSIDLPEGMDAPSLQLSMEKTNSGKFWLLGEYQEKTKKWQPILWELNEDNSWKKLADFDDLLSLGEDEEMCSRPVILESNKVLCSVANINVSPSEIRFYLIDPELEGGFRKLEVDTKDSPGLEAFPIATGNFTIHTLYSLDDNKVLVEVESIKELAAYPVLEALYVLDVTNNTITPLPKPTGYRPNIFRYFAEYDGAVYVLNHYDSSNPAAGSMYGKTVSINAFDTSTGVFSDLDAEKHKGLAEFNESHREVGAGTGFWDIYANNNPDMLLIEHEEGLFGYSNGGVRKLLGSEEVSSLYTERYFFDNEDSFFLFLRSFAGHSLYKYEKIAGA